MILRLTCPEGWRYHGWQRVKAELISTEEFSVVTIRVDVSQQLAGLLNSLWIVTGVEPPHLLFMDDAFFVLSGESFTMQDFAVCFEGLLDPAIKIECVDGVNRV